MVRMNISIENEISTLNGRINRLQEELNVLLSQREELIGKKREEDIRELYNLMKANELSVEDIYNLLTTMIR